MHLQAAQDLAKKRAAENMTVGDRITVFFRHIMEQWQQEIDKMQDDYLLSMEGKMLRATYDLTSKNLKHMYRQLKNNSLPDDVKRGMWLIVEAMQRRDYREAMDVYLRVSIGNAPWPIGVTMVGFMKFLVLPIDNDPCVLHASTRSTETVQTKLHAGLFLGLACVPNYRSVNSCSVVSIM